MQFSNACLESSARGLGFEVHEASYTCAMNATSKSVGPDFVSFTSSLIGMPLSSIWRGYGSAIFLEFGELHRGNLRRDGSEGNMCGDWTLGIEWSWRIEGKRRIWCGSWSDEERWPRVFARITDKTVNSLSLYGRLPEVAMGLSNGLYILSMMTAEGDPQWWLTRRAQGNSTSIFIRAGKLQIDPRPKLR
jgi:hypothetical protein